MPRAWLATYAEHALLLEVLMALSALYFREAPWGWMG